MKVALFSDIITWIGEGEIPDQTPASHSPSRRALPASEAPDAVIDPEGTVYTNLALQGGTYLLVTHPEFAAAYVQNQRFKQVYVKLTDIKMLSKPESTQGA
jgi:hypothetical protein